MLNGGGELIRVAGYCDNDYKKDGSPSFYYYYCVRVGGGKWRFGKQNTDSTKSSSKLLVGGMECDDRSSER